MNRLLVTVSSGCLIAILTCAPAWAQATAQISGTARDQSGAVLPGVDITATQAETGLVRTTVTNEAGAYVLPNLPLGPYRVEAALSGFRSYVQTGIVLQVNSSPVIDPVLEVGQLEESVAVEANAALVETRSSAVGSLVNTEQILELPLNGRNVTDLIMLAGAAVYTAEGRGASLVGAASPQIAVAGSAGYGVDYTLDGANHVSYVTGSTMVMPFPDATQEFKVETSGVTAQRGNSTAVAVVTKSGTNELHGSLFEFLRNDLFNATNFFAAVDPQTGKKKQSTLKRNQFGGTVGGPIVRNQLFFFGGYQGTTRRQDPLDRRAFIPTAAMLAGDWTAVTSPACNNGQQITLRAPFVNNRVDPALYSKPALFIVNWKGPKMPFPTTDNPCGEITYGNMSQENEGIYVGKIDYQQTNDHSLFGRVMLQTFDSPNPMEFNTNLLQETGYRTSIQGSYTVGSTYVISSSSVNAFRFAVNRTANRYRNVEQGELFNWCQAGVNLYCGPEITRINGMNINGGFPLNSGFLTGHQYVGTSYSMNDDVTLVRGAHQLSFGGSVLYGVQNNFAVWASPHQFRFTGAATGLGLADFMLGRAGNLFTGISNPHNVTGTTVAVYGTDTWRATPRLTLTAGVRWEPYIPQHTEAIYHFDYDRFRQGIKSTVYANAPAGLYYRGDPGIPENGVNNRWLQFAPRLGLAWDVTGDGRTSVRTSYALGYLHVPGNFRETYSGSSPWGGRVTLVSPPGGLEDPWRGIPGGNIFPYELNANAPFPPLGLFYTQPFDLRTPYSQSWNLSVQRQVARDVLVSASYLGSHISHAWSNKALNPAIFFPGVADASGTCRTQGYTFRVAPGAVCSTAQNTNARRRFTLERPEDGEKIGFVAEADDEGTQIYHGMILTLDRRDVRGVTVNANYTWSHCVGDYAVLYNPMGAHPTDTYADPDNRALDRGNCDSDRRHVLNLTTVVETPQFSHPTLRLLASGWRVSGIYTTASGAPLTVLSGTDRALNGLQVGAQQQVLQRADQVLADPYGDRSGRPGTRYLNPAAFALPALGSLGNIERNSIRGPRQWSFDMALSRIFPVGDQRFEFRVEAYNVTNSFRAIPPSVVLSDTNTFGVIRESLDPRILQFALKYLF